VLEALSEEDVDWSLEVPEAVEVAAAVVPVDAVVVVASLPIGPWKAITPQARAKEANVPATTRRRRLEARRALAARRSRARAARSAAGGVGMRRS
jgi:hypothetical protein